MRRALLTTPHLLFERLAQGAARRYRLRRLRNTPAHALSLSHIESLELLDIVQRDIAPLTIYDVGANVGSWAVLARAICPQARIEAFEPLERLRDQFLRTVALAGDVTLHEVALGATATRAPMFVHHFADASSFLPLAAPEASRFPDHLAETPTLSLVPLDDYVTQNDLPLPDLIKLDVQGFELEVLRGATQTLRHARAVISEVSFREIYAGQPRFGALAGFLAQAGLEPVAFRYGMPTGEVLDQADVLFLRCGDGQ